MGTIQYAVLNDIHFPFEGPQYMKALALMSHFPDLRHIYLNGDIAEVESVSRHPKNPMAHRNLMAELDYTNHKLKELENLFPGCSVTYICGNHEYRVFRYIRDLAPELWGMVDCPLLLRFNERPGWKFIDYSPTQWVKCGATNNLWLRHEPLGFGTSHAKSTAEKSYVSVIYGHLHQFQQFTHKKMGPEPYLVTATSNGWLGDIKQKVFDYRGSRDNWITGFTRIDCDEKTGEYEVRFIAVP